MTGALELAKDIASKSPVAVQGTKVNLIYSRDHSVDESMQYMVRVRITQEMLLNNNYCRFFCNFAGSMERLDAAVRRSSESCCCHDAKREDDFF